MLHRTATLLLGLLTLTSALAEKFCFVALPDTQRYSENLTPPIEPALSPDGTYRFFTDQTRWIAENAEKLGIKFVVHLGDIVQTSTEIPQWERAKSAMDVLTDAGVPFGTVIGNHDLLRKKGHIYDAYLAYFGPKHLKNNPHYRSASPQGTSTYFVVDHGKYKFLFLNLSYATPREDVEWADTVLKENRDKVVIVSTHAYLWDVGMVAGRYGESVGFAAMSNRINLSGRIEGSMTSQEFYDRFVTKHPNILMVECGHSGLDWYRTDGVNGSGKPVLEVLTNYQILPNGGEGYLRIYEIDPEVGTLSARSYSPTHDRERTPFEHFVQMVGLSFEMNKKAEKSGIDSSLVKGAQIALLKRDSVPEIDVVAEHPDYKARRDYYLQLFKESFFNHVPEEAGQPEDWEAFWMKAFAPDPKEPTNYAPNTRSPSFTIKVNLDDYVTTGK